jgi:hypothetical protein
VGSENHGKAHAADKDEIIWPNKDLWMTHILGQPGGFVSPQQEEEPNLIEQTLSESGICFNKDFV